MSTDMKPILVIGSLNMDLVVRCETLPQPGQTVVGRDFFTAAGGKGANQAVAAGKLGASVRMAGCVGSDDFGRTLIAGLRAAGVDAEDVTAVDDATGTALIAVDAAGCNSIVVVPGANAHCDATLAESSLACAPHPGILLLQQEIPPAANARAIKAARAAGWFVMLNPAPARPVPGDLLKLIDVVIPNADEAAAITGRAVASRDDAFLAARALVAMGARTALVTLGADGAVCYDGKAACHCPALPVEAVDTTAAGDAYIGALATALAAGDELINSLGFAAAAAALTVTRLGAQPSLPSRGELDAFIAQHGTPSAQPVLTPARNAAR
jgi:ribokinase